MAASTRRRATARRRDGGDGAGPESAAELRRAHEQLALILDGIADGVTVEDRRGRLVYANAAAADLLGYPSADALLAAEPAQVLGRLALMDAAGHPFPLERLPGRLALERGGVHQATLRFCSVATGEERRAIVRGAPLGGQDGEGGEAQFAVNTFRDVTEQQRAEEALRRSEERFRSLIQNSSDVVIIADAAGEIRYLSPSIERVLGYRAAEMVETSAFAMVHPDDRDRAERFLAAIAAAPGTSATIELRVRHADASWRLVEVVACNSLGDPGVEGVIINLRDISERDRAEGELRASEARFRAIFERAAMGIALVDREGRLLAVNPAMEQLVGYGADELLGQTSAAYTHPDDRKIQDELIGEVLAGRRDGYRLEKRYLRKDGQEVWARVTLSAIRGTGDDPGFAISMIEDIAERKRAREALREREAQYRGIFEATSDGLVINALDGAIVEANPAMCAMHGYTREELLGLHPTAFIHPDYHHVLEEYLARVAAGAAFQTRAIDLRKDGTPVHVEIHGSPITYQGRPHILGVIRDVSERVEAYQLLEQRVEERTHELATLLDISQNVASTLELGPLLGVILDQLKIVVEYTAAGVYVAEGDDFRAIEFRGPLPREAALRMRFKVAGPRAAWEQLSRGETVIIPDLQAYAESVATIRAGAGDYADQILGYTRSRLHVPLLHKEQFIGMFSITHERPDYFTPRHAALATAVASQAAVAIANARLYEHVEERTHELATLLDISRNVASTLELGPLLSLVLDQLKTVVDYTAAGIYAVEDDDLVSLDFRGPIPGEEMRRFRLPVAVMHDAWPQLSRGEPVIIPDLHADAATREALRAGAGELGETILGYTRSRMYVPLLHKEQTIGMFSITHERPGYFTPRHADLALAMASQAAVAIENARLYERVEQRTRELATLLEVSRTVASTLELGPLLGLILDQVKIVVEYAAAGVYVVEDDDFVPLDFRGPIPREDVLRFRFPLTTLHDAWPRLSRGEPVIIPDLHADAATREALRAGAGELGETILGYTRSRMYVPLLHKEQTIGMLSVTHDRPGYYTPRHADLVLAIANQAAVAIENARLYERVEQRTRELQTLLDVSHNVTSTLELKPLLELIFDGLKVIADYDGATIYLLEGDELVTLDGRNPRGSVPTAALRIQTDQSGPIWQRLRRREPVMVADVWEDTPEARAYRRAIGEERLRTTHSHIRSWLTVPLFAQDRSLGMLTLSKSQLGYYTARHAALVMAIANQMAVTLENARLYADLQQRLAQMEGLSAVGAALAAERDLERVLRTVGERVIALLDAGGGAIALLDPDAARRPGEELELAVVIGNAAEQLRGRRLPLDHSFAGEAIRTGGPVVSEDAQRDPRGHAPAVRAAGVEALLAVPLQTRERTVGALSVRAGAGRKFGGHDIAVMTLFAQQAAVAIENARLYNQAREATALAERRLRELEALYRADEELYRSLHLDDVLNALVDVATEILQADKSTVLVWDARRERLVAGAARGFSAEAVAQMVHAPGQGITGLVAVSGQPIAVADAMSDPRVVHRITDPEGIRSLVHVPIVVDGEVFGVFGVNYVRQRDVGEEEQRLLLALAQRAALAIENARLYERAQRAAALEERQRLARELHDSVSQALYGMALGARTARTLLDRDPGRVAEPLDYVLSLAEAGLAEMRALIFELRPESLANEGLVAALEKQAAALRARHHLAVEIELGAEPAIALDLKEALYRVAQEAMHNTVKHARADRVHLRLGHDGAVCALEVSDNGRGFDPTGSFPGHLGLRSMRERVERLGGTFSIASAAGEGTRIRAELPVP